jgi:hypothetical protein
MGTHGLRGVPNLELGSVATKLIHLPAVPGAAREMITFALLQRIRPLGW